MKASHYWELSCGQCGAVIGLAAVSVSIDEWLADMRDGDALRKWPISRPMPELGDCPHLEPAPAEEGPAR